MAKKISLLIFLFVLSSIIAVVSSQRCSGTGSFGEDSKYAINRENILSSLASNVKIHHGFYNGTMGGDRCIITSFQMTWIRCWLRPCLVPKKDNCC
ncbi:unnamed protein product [Brassica napus]|uniref:(rape) hypothetical protein n=1 Tax=Brassica napus TaxID=3708 RepID=A0A816IYU9_BRANA|nr:unnamed protein product [Brassica napus]